MDVEQKSWVSLFSGDRSEVNGLVVPSIWVCGVGVCWGKPLCETWQVLALTDNAIGEPESTREGDEDLQGVLKMT